MARTCSVSAANTRASISTNCFRRFSTGSSSSSIAGYSRARSAPGIGGLTDFQKFLEGAPDGSFGGGGVFNHEYRTNDFAVFAQDDWKIRRI